MKTKPALVRCSDVARWMATQLGITIDQRTVREWVKAKKLKGRRIGGFYYVDRSAFDELKKAG